ncbi:MAG: glutaredoxin domain-containing protein [Thermodesulfobacteriota bacterium]
MKLTRICLIFCSLPLAIQLLLPAPAFSKLYTWTDRNGVVRRTYYPPPPDQVKKSKPAKKRSSVQRTTEQNQVELYVTSWCPYCKQAKQFFKSRGISYRAYDIEKDSAAAARKKQLDGKSGVPFAIVNGIPIHGYSEKRYSGALK